MPCGCAQRSFRGLTGCRWVSPYESVPILHSQKNEWKEWRFSRSSLPERVDNQSAAPTEVIGAADESWV